MEKWLLKLVHIFDSLFRKQGIDIAQLYTIVETKMVMDKRRVYLNWRKRGQKENENHLTMVLIVYGLFSVFIGAMILFLPSFLLAMIFLHGYVIFMMAMTLITDFSAVLLDTADNDIILPKPVNSRTLFMARQVHIMLYLFQFTIAFTLIPVCCTMYTYGILTGLAACITLVLSVLLSVFFTYLLYLAILRFSNEAKIKEIINWFQIGMSIFIALSFQILPRMIDMTKLADHFQLHWYSYLLPPVWMALALETVYTLHIDAVHLLMICLAVLLPMLLFWILSRFLAPYFTKRLSLLNNNVGTVKAPPVSTSKNITLSQRLSFFTGKNSIIKGGFEMTWKITSRDKFFRLQFYPSLGLIAVFVFIFAFKSGKDVLETWQQMPESNSFLWFIYLPVFPIANAILFVSFSENFAASWVYYSTPLQRPGELILGSLMSLFVKYFFPIYFLMAAFSLYVWGWKVADDFLFGLANDYLCFLIWGVVGQKYLPFSRQPNTRQQTGRFILVMLQMIMISALVGIHYLLIRYSWLLYIAFPVIVLLCWLLQQQMRRLQWKQIAM
jgi:ABC-2 type transport system permease protein